jgi:sulfite reductase (NADPH) hemoprotein beta-component
MITAGKPTRNEGLKLSSPWLSGTISQTLADPASDRFSEDDYEFLKFHGIYQQDDRDVRKVARQYSLMVRTKFPGGTLSAEQYLVCDRLASQYGNNTMRITTRQDLQFHGILKANLRQTMKDLNAALISTLAACGDVGRNVMAPPTPATSPFVEEVLARAREVSQALAPSTPAYHSIWVEGKELDMNSEEQRNFIDPLYGKTYLPRKFKVGFVIPPRNDVDIFTQDLGFIAVEESGRLAGYNVVAGGGLGMSHGNSQTFPRLADLVGFITPEQLEATTRAVLGIHRDFGDRTNRKRARLKYVLQDRGVDWFRTELENRAGFRVSAARPFRFTQQGDLLGWHAQTDGKWFLGLFVENGRVWDQENCKLKTALREVIERVRPEVRLTATQNLLLVNVTEAGRAEISEVLARHGVSSANPFSRTRLASMACPALPTCGLALAESERALPDIITKIEGVLEELGLGQQELVVRMTGCPNGCSRPYMAELAFVGKAPNKYQIYIGGNEAGTRLNHVYKDSVKGEDLIAEVRGLLTQYRAERQEGERFGDFCARALGSALASPAA